MKNDHTLSVLLLLNPLTVSPHVKGSAALLLQAFNIAEKFLCVHENQTGASPGVSWYF